MKYLKLYENFKKLPYEITQEEYHSSFQSRSINTRLDLDEDFEILKNVVESAGFTLDKLTAHLKTTCNQFNFRKNSSNEFGKLNTQVSGHFIKCSSENEGEYILLLLRDTVVLDKQGPGHDINKESEQNFYYFKISPNTLKQAVSEILKNF